MSELTYSVEKDLKEAQALAAGLVPYIYEDELYGRVGLNMPSLTLGAVLLRLHRLRALIGQLNDRQRETLQQVEAHYESIRKEWQTHFEKKLLREAEARIRDVQTYLNECKDDLKLCANAYLPEALRRTMIEEVIRTMEEETLHSSGLRDKLNRVDSGLRRYIQPTSFIWDETLKSVYPLDNYWWLYHRPPYPDEGKK